MTGRIIFPTIEVPTPVGGLRVLMQHVAILRNAGFDALPWYPEASPAAEGRPDTPALHGTDLGLAADDLLVIPEPCVVSGFDPAPGVRKAIFNQNHFFTYLTWADDLPYPGWKPEPQIWAVSRESVDVLSRLHPDLKPWLVPNFIDTGLFRPGRRERPVISWIPRKRPHEGSLVRRLFQADPRSAGVEFHEISHVPRAEVARIMAATSVFLSLGHTESFGLPTAEALASGCLVVGYTGGGGEHLFEAPGAWTIPDQRPVLLVEKAFELLESGAATSGLGERNHQWVRENLSLESTRGALIQAVHAALEGPGAAGRAAHPILRLTEPPRLFEALG